MNSKAFKIAAMICTGVGATLGLIGTFLKDKQTAMDNEKIIAEQVKKFIESKSQ